MCLVGIPDVPPPVAAGALIMRRRTLAGSLIGGIRETQEMLDFCAAHDVASDIELIPIERINEGYAELKEGGVARSVVVF